MRQQTFLLIIVCIATLLVDTTVAYSSGVTPMEGDKAVASVRPVTPSDAAEELYHKGVNAKLGGEYAKALGYFRQAASMGHLDAQQEIGSMYQFGEGVSKNYAEALKWYYAPATKGDVLAQYFIGTLYYEGGWGLMQNYTEALKWFAQAAVKNNASAQSYLGLMYEKGYGTAPDYEKALTYYRQAAVQGDAAAKHNLVEFEKKYTPQNGLKGDAGLAAEDAYRQGHNANIRKDYAQALPLLTKAASMGHAKAQFELGALYDLGDGVPQNYAEAMKWYRKAAEQGNASAQGNIGVLYENGQGVPQNYEEAVKWYRMAMENGNPFAQGNIARVEQKRMMAKRDYVAATSRNDEIASNTPSKITPANSGNKKRPLGCYAVAGYDEPNHAYDDILGTDTKDCYWKRPQKGNKDSNGWISYICSTDWQQEITINVSYNSRLKQWVASSQVGKYGINNEWHVYVGENDKFWVFSNVEPIFYWTTSCTPRPGYDLYIAKDWTLVGLSHEPDVVYDQMVSPRKDAEIQSQIKITGKSPQMLINDRLNAATDALRKQTQTDIRRMMDEADQKIDAINRQSLERYTSGRNSNQSSSTVRGIQYAPDYTGGQYLYWCAECKKWGPQHVHFDLK